MYYYNLEKINDVQDLKTEFMKVNNSLIFKIISKAKEVQQLAVDIIKTIQINIDDKKTEKPKPRS